MHNCQVIFSLLPLFQEPNPKMLSIFLNLRNGIQSLAISS